MEVAVEKVVKEVEVFRMGKNLVVELGEEVVACLQE